MGLRLVAEIGVLRDDFPVSVPLPGFMGLRPIANARNIIASYGFSPVARIHGVAT